MAERKAFLLRIDADVWAELEAWAQDDLRSVNGQIEYVLRQALQRRKGGQGGRELQQVDSPRGAARRRGGTN